MTKINQARRNAGATADRNQRRQNLLDLAAAEKVRQAQEGKIRDRNRTARAKLERRFGSFA